MWPQCQHTQNQQVERALEQGLASGGVVSSCHSTRVKRRPGECQIESGAWVERRRLHADGSNDDGFHGDGVISMILRANRPARYSDFFKFEQAGRAPEISWSRISSSPGETGVVRAVRFRLKLPSSD